MKHETEVQMLDRLGDDAAKWAAEFRKIAVKLGYSDMDEGWLIGWFANAIEHSWTVRQQRGHKHSLRQFRRERRNTRLCTGR
jgi:hypothetical protein